MKDLDKIDDGEKAPINQNDSKKETIKSTASRQSEVAAKGLVESKEIKPVNKKRPTSDAKVAVVKSAKKEKAEPEPMVQNVVLIDLKEEPENPELDKKQKKKIKVVKKNAKKEEEKVDKLKKKVKKAKKKDVKKRKLKGLKEKLENALEKLKDKVEKIKEVKKAE